MNEFSDSISNLRPLGKIAAKTYVIKVYKNGSSVGFVWRWWNPLSWVLFPLLCIFSVLYVGIPGTIEDKAALGLGVDDYFKIFPEQLKWIPTSLLK